MHVRPGQAIAVVGASGSGKSTLLNIMAGHDKQSDGTLKYALDNNIKHTYSETNIGLCSSMNKAYSLTTTDHILYAHDDMYFCKDWDIFLINEIQKYNNNFFIKKRFHILTGLRTQFF